MVTAEAGSLGDCPACAPLMLRLAPSTVNGNQLLMQLEEPGHDR